LNDDRRGPLKTVGFGGCMLNNPLNIAHRSRILNNATFKKVGFTRTPAAFTPGAIRQLIEFCDRAIDIPVSVQPYCFLEAGLSDPVQLSPDASALLRSADVFLVELVTPNETYFREWRLNYNYITAEVQKRANEISKEAGVLANEWRSKGLTKGNQEARARFSAELLTHWPTEGAADLAMREVIAEARGEMRTVDQMVEDLEWVRSAMGMPMVMVQHVFKYMPDGRTVSWPSTFMDDVAIVADRLGVPLFRPSEVVAKHGVPNMMAADFRHYQKEQYPIIGQALAEFVAGALGSRA
jgi:hypothetical protein